MGQKSGDRKWFSGFEAGSGQYKSKNTGRSDTGGKHTEHARQLKHWGYKDNLARNRDQDTCTQVTPVKQLTVCAKTGSKAPINQDGTHPKYNNAKRKINIKSRIFHNHNNVTHTPTHTSSCINATGKLYKGNSFYYFQMHLFSRACVGKLQLNERTAWVVKVSTFNCHSWMG